MMIVRRLLKSCATPPVRWPIASILTRLPQRFLGSHATVDLFIQMLRPAQDREQGQEKNQRRRNSENQMARHAGDPLVANGGTCDSGAQVQGRFTEAAHAKTPLDQVDRRGRRVKAALRVLGNGAAEAVRSSSFSGAPAGGRVARQESAVRAQHGILQAGGIGQGREEANEVAREHGGFEDSCEHAVTGQPPADREERLTVELRVMTWLYVGIRRRNSCAVCGCGRHARCAEDTESPPRQ